ncbi:MAG: hypothetical protein RLZ47_1619 [Bacteroidota bacterium]|jgi:hypothetical protein
MNRKFRFLLILLFTVSHVIQLDAKSRDIRWFDYKSALRRKINIDTKELRAEISPGKWELLGKVNVDPLALKDLPLGFVNSHFHMPNDSLIYFTIFGTGQVYEFKPTNTTLRRIDQTYYRGYNFGSIPFIRKGKLYSAGGYGFWHYSNVLTTYNFNKSEWEVVIPRNVGPEVINEYGFNGYSNNEDVFYSGASTNENLFSDLKRYRIKQFFKYDFKNQQWTELGSINEELLAETSREIYWNGTYFLQWASNKLYIIDPLANEIFVYKNNERFFVSNKEYFSKGDTIYNYWSDDNGGLEYFSVKEYLKNAEYVGPFYSRETPLLHYLLIFCIICSAAGSFWMYKRKIGNTRAGYFDSLEEKLLLALMKKHTKGGLSSQQVNDSLLLHTKSFDNQRRVRINVINKINQKMAHHYKITDAILRLASAEDKRQSIYKLSPEAYQRLKEYFK